jgi:hypothetical protein
VLQRNNIAKYEMQMQMQISKKELLSQLTLEPGDECVAYGSNEQIEQKNQNQASEEKGDQQQNNNSGGGSRKKSSIVNGGNKYNNNRMLNSIQSKSTHHGGSNTAGSNTESNNTAGSNELKGQPADQMSTEPNVTNQIKLPSESVKNR